MKTIYIDGYIFDYEQLGGISRMWFELIKNILLLSRNVKFAISLKEDTENAFVRDITKLIPKSSNRLALIKEKRISYPYSKIVGSFGPLRALSNYKKLVSDNIGVDIFHSSFASTIYPGIKSIPAIVTVHDLSIQRFKYIFATSPKNYIHYYRRLITRNFAIKKADCLIAVSQSTKNDMMDYFGMDEHKIKVIHHGISSDWFTPSDIGEDRPYPYFLYVGGRNPYKNYDVVLRAIAKLNGKYKGIKLITVGDNSHSFQMEQQKYSELGIIDRIIDLGIVDEDTLKHLYTNAVAFIFPSLYEGFGFPLLESLACGSPVIASEIPTNKEFGKSYVTLFDPQNPSELVEKMIGIYDNPPDKNERLQYLEHAKTYTWKNAAHQLLEVYLSLV